MEFIRYRVVAASSPGIAAQYPPYSEDEAFDGAVLAEGLRPYWEHVGVNLQLAGFRGEMHT